MTLKGHRNGVVEARSVGPRHSTGVFSIPAHIMRAIPKGSIFNAEWHEDGILYRFLGDSPEEADERPRWAKGEPPA